MCSALTYYAVPEKNLFLKYATNFHLDWNSRSPEKISVDLYQYFLSSASGIPYVLRTAEDTVVELRVWSWCES